MVCRGKLRVLLCMHQGEGAGGCDTGVPVCVQRLSHTRVGS